MKTSTGIEYPVVSIRKAQKSIERNFSRTVNQLSTFSGASDFRGKFQQRKITEYWIYRSNFT